MKISIIIAIILLILNINAFSQSNPEADVLKKIDTEFSDYSKLYGAKDAFLKYLDDAGVMLRRNHYPIAGREKIIADLFADDNGGYTLTWTPLFAEIASSGEIGYTYGTWDLDSKDDNGNPVNTKGTYVTIWKKDSGSNWKFVLDTGNSGLEPPKK